MTEETKNFSDLNLDESLVEACQNVGWKNPTKVQLEVIPHGLKGLDVIALAETGSGKTGAFALPILNSLLQKPQRLYALVLTPTRELAFQIAEQFEALGTSIGLKCAVVVGGVDMVSQAIALSKKPHIIIATPGRLVDHLENTKGFSIKSIKYLVLDEADRILNMDFEEELDKIVKVSPVERITYLFSATMSSKIQKLQRACLKDPVRIEISSKYGTVETLKQYYLFIPQKYKLPYLVYIVTKLMGNTFMIFCATCLTVQKVSLMLKHLDFSVTSLHGQLDQNKRLAALKRFKAQKHSILVATDVASRGLDIPHVDVVVNFDIPLQSKDYIHRVGRTARAGRSGVSITMVSQYEIDFYLRIEKLIDKKLELYPTIESEVMQLLESVNEAERLAKIELRAAKDTNTDVALCDEDNDALNLVPGMPNIKLPNRKRKSNKSFKKSR